MIKCKIFDWSEYSRGTIEDLVNAWLKDHPNIEITHVQYNRGVDRHCLRASICLFYK